MTSDPGSEGGLRLAHVTTALTRAIDLAFGQSTDHVLRTCSLANGLGAACGLGEDDTATLYWVAQLRFVGCTAHAHEVSSLVGDEIAARADALTLDVASPRDVLTWTARHAGAGEPPLAKARAVLAALAAGKGAVRESFRGGCEAGAMLTGGLGLDASVAGALADAFERWDGQGFPAGRSGDDLSLPMRVVHVSQEMEIFGREGGAELAIAMAEERAGKAYDPEVAAVFVREADWLLSTLEKGSIREQVLAAEAEPRAMVPEDGLDDVLTVLADFADLKSPFTAGHSRGVADLARAGAEEAGLPADDVVCTYRAGLVHDLGRAAVPNSVWDKHGPLGDGEWEQVRLHPYCTERALASTPLEQLGRIGACHHERADGSGYHRGLRAADVSPPAALVGAADVFHALGEERPHRPAVPRATAVSLLRELAADGKLEGSAVEAVLGAAGHRRSRRARERREWPDGLTTREVEVLRLLARGSTNKEIAAELHISPKTAGHHVEHIYTKVGVSTRGAVALYAARNGLADSFDPG